MNPQSHQDVEPLSIGMSAATATVAGVDLLLPAAASSNDSAVDVDQAALLPTSRRQRIAGCK